MIDRCLEGLIRQAEIQEVKEGIESILIAIKTQNLWLFDRQKQGRLYKCTNKEYWRLMIANTINRGMK